MQETQVQSLGQKDPLEKEMATYSNILAWKIPWTVEPGELQSIGWQKVRYDSATEQLGLQLSMILNSFQLDAFLQISKESIYQEASGLEIYIWQNNTSKIRYLSSLVNIFL